MADRGIWREHEGVAALGCTQVSGGELGGVRWELARRAPVPVLAPFVAELQGYFEQAALPVLRREHAGLHVVIILELEPRLRVYEPGSSAQHAVYPGGFVAGLGDHYTRTEHDGFQTGIQLNLHPLGARRLFDLPMHELRGKTVAFADLVPGQRLLCDELAELRGWDARFERVERFLLERFADTECDRAVTWAAQRIAADGGGTDLAQLARELGYSHKHMISRFHDQLGVPPKVWARLQRFDRLRRELLRAGGRRSWAELAQACGYYDQSHMSRDIKQFTGESPRAMLGPRLFQEAL